MRTGPKTTQDSSREILRRLWPAYALAIALIGTGFDWALPGPYNDETFQADEGAAVAATARIGRPDFNPQRLTWGTGLFYQVFAVRTAIRGGNLWDFPTSWLFVIGRGVVAISALGAITWLYLIGRFLFDERVGQLSAVLLAVSPGFVVNAHYFKTDIPMVCWTLLAVLAGVRTMQTGSMRWLLGLGLLAGYATSIKYSAAVCTPMAGTALLLTPELRRRLGAWVVLGGAVAVGFLVGEPYALLDFPKLCEDVSWVAGVNTAGKPYTVARPPAWIDYPVGVMRYTLTTPLLVASGIGLVGLMLRGGRALAPIWVLLACYFAVLAADGVRLVRYSVPLVPFAVLAVAWGLLELSRQPHGRVPAQAIGALLVVHAGIFSFSAVRVFAMQDPRITASRWFEANVPRDLPIAVSRSHPLDLPRFELFGYETLNVHHEIATLAAAPGPYFVISDFTIRFHMEAIEHYPESAAFFAYVHENYELVAEFENSQRLLWVDSKAGNQLPQDWLHPNPKVSVYRRRGGDGREANPEGARSPRGGLQEAAQIQTSKVTRRLQTVSGGSGRGDRARKTRTQIKPDEIRRITRGEGVTFVG